MSSSSLVTDDILVESSLWEAFNIIFECDDFLPLLSYWASIDNSTGYNILHDIAYATPF